jgi:hypothetical protein
MKKPITIFLIFLLVGLTACEAPGWGFLRSGSATETFYQIPIPLIETATATKTPLRTVLPSTVEAPTPTLGPEAYQGMPIIPVVSARMVEVYRAGLAAGRDPMRFSKIGDCQNITTYFLAAFDDPGEYRLGSQYEYLQPTIDHFAGSWSRKSLAVKGGLNVAAALSPIWADPAQCRAGETPIACEIRVYNPSIVIVSMEESFSGDLVHYNMYLRKIVEYILSQNVVPILATRAELPDSNNSINDLVTRVAYNYQVPLWNFWAATDPLPEHGLVDGFHLSQAANFFNDPASMQNGWPWRNLTALESIDAVYRAVSGNP